MTFLRLPGLAWAVIAAVAGLTALAVVDEARESAAALDDFADNEAVAARLVAAELSSRLAGVKRDALVIANVGGEIPAWMPSEYTGVRLRRADEPALPASTGVVFSVPVQKERVVDLEMPLADLIAGMSGAVEAPSSRLFLVPPGETTLRGTDGRTLTDGELSTALGDGRASMQLARPDAVKLGLPERMAFAGLTSVDAGHLGRWGVVVAASAERERDRERRAGYRLVIGVLLTGGLVASFGGIALRRQRKELDLERTLAVTEVERRADERLASANRAATLGTMALGIAHELSTPLSVIAGRAQQILARANGEERSSTSARAILDQTDRIGEVVRGFLALARGQQPAVDRLKAQALVDAAASLVEHRFLKAQVALVPEVEPGLPQVHGDARLLEQALVNLLLNACDACKPGGRVEVRVERRDAFVAFVVVDDGHGISPDDLAHVMEPFFTTKAHGEGTGLGLAVTLEIAKSHRGTLLLEPETPRGTRAELCIPIANGEATLS